MGDWASYCGEQTRLGTLFYNTCIKICLVHTCKLSLNEDQLSQGEPSSQSRVLSYTGQVRL